MSTEAMTPRRCCACGELKSPCRTIATLNLKAPVAGTGWACFQCHLPADGATAVICDGCADNPDMEIKWALVHGIDSDKRIPIAELSGRHEHDRRFHPEIEDPPLISTTNANEREQMAERITRQMNDHAAALGEDVAIGATLADWLVCHGYLQLALRHPRAIGPTRQSVEAVIATIEDALEQFGVFDAETLEFLRTDQAEVEVAAQTRRHIIIPGDDEQ